MGGLGGETWVEPGRARSWLGLAREGLPGQGHPAGGAAEQALYLASRPHSPCPNYASQPGPDPRCTCGGRAGAPDFLQEPLKSRALWGKRLARGFSETGPPAALCPGRVTLTQQHSRPLGPPLPTLLPSGPGTRGWVLPGDQGTTPDGPPGAAPTPAGCCRGPRVRRSPGEAVVRLGLGGQRGGGAPHGPRGGGRAETRAWSHAAGSG